jgi:hypothetical protein
MTTCSRVLVVILKASEEAMFLRCRLTGCIDACSSSHCSLLLPLGKSADFCELNARCIYRPISSVESAGVRRPTSNSSSSTRQDASTAGISRLHCGTEFDVTQPRITVQVETRLGPRASNHGKSAGEEDPFAVDGQTVVPCCSTDWIVQPPMGRVCQERSLICPLSARTGVVM